MLIVVPFKFENMGLTEKKYYRSQHSKTLRENGLRYADWAIKLFRSTASKPPTGYNYDATSLRMSEKNCQRLEKHLDSWTDLAFSPCIDEHLNDDQVAIDLTKIYSKIR